MSINQLKLKYFQLCEKLLINPTPIPVRGYILNYLDRLNNNKNKVIAVIGDGAMSAGMAYEAMNNAGALKYKVIVTISSPEPVVALIK